MEEKYKKNKEILVIFARQFESFDYDKKIGRAKNIELELQFRPNSKVARIADILYDSKRNEFLKGKILEWEKNGFVQQGFAKYLFTPIIVGKRGSKEKFRVCFNFQPLNEAIYDSNFQGKDADRIRACMAKAQFICAIDMPYAHQQIGLVHH